MVVSWSPEPSKCMDGGVFSLRENHINLDTEDSEDEAIATPYFGYELLPHESSNINNGDGETHSDGDSSEPEEATIHSIEQSITINNLSDESSGEETIRSDIEINPEEVRSIMSNITLPPSSFPTWACNIPESQWTSYLVSRITNMQNENKEK
ncbi:uncharacterized protein LOC106663910 [Cimex lectularius]|uniref:Male-enhanced antigen 1 n=1 Tax=Cimex lectularius TaxID=79782 RepID=A0A8I6REH5_CIMLE|nr:uncharacterized protein LOC106663910 [Cimex lectularius]